MEVIIFLIAIAIVMVIGLSLIILSLLHKLSGKGKENDNLLKNIKKLEDACK